MMVMMMVMVCEALHNWLHRRALLVESSSLLELEAVGGEGIIEGVNVKALNALAKQR
jgi:hypothetical protein